MIDYIRGAVSELTPTYAVIETSGGVGYMLNISLNTYTHLQGDGEARLYVYESIREDAYVLYGFTERRERELFLLLVSVSGVGPSIARMILSSITVSDLEAAISAGDTNALKLVKGIGVKTAQRIIVDLKDKIKPVGNTLIEQISSRSEVYDEALAAMIALGFAQQQSQKALKELFAENPAVTVEQAIKCALKMM